MVSVATFSIASFDHQTDTECTRAVALARNGSAKIRTYFGVQGWCEVLQEENDLMHLYCDSQAFLEGSVIILAAYKGEKASINQTT